MRLRTDALYAIRGMTHDTDEIASLINAETNHLTNRITMPHWHWKPRLERLVSVA